MKTGYFSFKQRKKWIMHFFDVSTLTLEHLGGDIVLMPEVFICLSAHYMKCLIQRSLRNQSLWQERFIDSSDGTLIFSEDQLRDGRNYPLGSVSLINKVSPWGKKVVLYAVVGTLGEKQKISVIYKTTAHLSGIIKQHFDNWTMLRQFSVFSAMIGINQIAT